MSDKSGIEWTDATWNPVRGCVKVSLGCKHCYAETFAERFRGVKGHPYEQGFDLRLVPEKLDEPLRWKKPRRIFVNSMSDLFQDGVPFAFVDKVFAVMAMASRHSFQVLTKRADQMRQYASSLEPRHEYGETGYTNGIVADHCSDRHWRYFAGVIDGRFSRELTRQVAPFIWPLPNVLLGVSVENEEYAHERLPHLRALKQQGWRTFVSYEPALGPVDWEPWDDAIDWLISGGESGPGARPSHPNWHRAARDFCQRHNIPYFFKQWGGVRKKAAGAELDFTEWKQFPQVQIGMT